MKVIAVVGTSGSGKTTICEAIIRGLRQRGYRVGSVKEIHCQDFTLDPNPVANTRRHRAAGAQLVTAWSAAETDFLYPNKLSLEAILRHYDQDYVILEGVTQGSIPRITAAHGPEEARARINDWTLAISGVLANTHAGTLAGLPVLNALTEPEALVDLAEKGACPFLPSFDPDWIAQDDPYCRELAVARDKANLAGDSLLFQKIELSIDGTPVKTPLLVQKFLCSTLSGLFRDLGILARPGKIEVIFPTGTQVHENLGSSGER